jgi:hypothetical protein
MTFCRNAFFAALVRVGGYKYNVSTTIYIRKIGHMVSWSIFEWSCVRLTSGASLSLSNQALVAQW